MAKKKHQSSIELIKSYIDIVRKRLTTADCAFCNDVISKYLSNQQTKEYISHYVEKISRDKGLDQKTANDLLNDIEIYIEVSKALMLSWLPSNDAPACIPEKYYNPIPGQLRNAIITIPHHKLIITAGICSNTAWYGSQRDKAGALLTIKVFKRDIGGWVQIYDGSFVDTQYPRYSVVCGGSTECSAYIETTLNSIPLKGTKKVSRPECMIGSQRSKICPQEIDCMKEYGMGLRDFHALVVMCFDRWQNRPMRMNSKKRDLYNCIGVSAIIPKTSQWEHISEGFREIQLCDYPEFVLQKTAIGYHVEDRASPCEHERRGHIRTLRDGRKVFVSPSIVNKGGEKVVYKVIE
jgi:hypothetical protein